MASDKPRIELHDTKQVRNSGSRRTASCEVGRLRPIGRLRSASSYPTTSGVVTVLRGDEAPEYRPNIRLVMPVGGARTLAGPLANHPTVSIGPPSIPKEPIWRSREGRSLAAIEAGPSLRVEAGPMEIRIDLPWGSWSKVVAAPDVGPARIVRLPRKIGTPPLRVALDPQPASKAAYLVYGTSGTVPTGRISAYGEPRGVGLRKTKSGEARWALAAPKSVALERGTAVIRLGKGTGALFPILDGRQLAVEWSRRGLRVEPLSGWPHRSGTSSSGPAGSMRSA